MSDSLESETHEATMRLLERENERLREEQTVARRAEYRRSATGMLSVGLLAVIGALLLPTVREVLLVLGAIGIFAGLLVYYLTPETFVSASVGESVYSTLANNHDAIVDALGLENSAIYVPSESAVFLYVPEQESGTVPDVTETPFPTAASTRGLLVTATGSELLELLTTVEPANTLPARIAQVSDALVEGFELVENIEPSMETEDQQVTFAVTGAAFGPLDRFDHPVPSVLATGIATHVDIPVHVAITQAEGRADWLVTCDWSA